MGRAGDGSWGLDGRPGDLHLGSKGGGSVVRGEHHVRWDGTSPAVTRGLQAVGLGGGSHSGGVGTGAEINRIGLDLQPWLQSIRIQAWLLQ